MVSKIISLGDKIEMKRVRMSSKFKSADDEQDRVYISQVYDIISEDEMKIAMPIVEGKVVPLPVNGRFDLSFYTSNGLYQCRAIITDRYKEDGLFTLQIEIISDIKKFQRRQYFRLECTKDIRYSVLSGEEILEIITEMEKVQEFLNTPLESGIALDISGGGMRFASKNRHSDGDNVLIAMPIKKVGKDVTCVLPGKIIKSKSVQNRTDMYEYRVEYNNLQRNVRETLIKFIFEEERRLRQEKKR